MAADRRKVALTALKGMGGVGKTELALFVANQIKDQFPDGQLFIQLRGTTLCPTPPVKVMEGVIRHLQPNNAALPTDEAVLGCAYRSALAEKRVLLVFDNAKDASQVRPLLPPLGCGLIVTSRDSLASLTEVDAIAVKCMTEDESIKLLRTFLKTKCEDDELKLIAKLCGYLPLALNVAASTVARPEWMPNEYINALSEERKKRLKIGDDETKDVEVVLSFSGAQLMRDDPGLAIRWQMLSVFPADFEEEAAAAVLAVEQVRAKESLSRLLDRHLVMFDENNRRYRIHDLLRDIARTVFDCEENHPLGSDSVQRLEAASCRHAEYYDRSFQPMEGGFENRDESKNVLDQLRWLQREIPNAISAFAWANKRLAPLLTASMTIDDVAKTDGAAGSFVAKMIKTVDWLFKNADKGIIANKNDLSVLSSPNIAQGYLALAAYHFHSGRTDDACDYITRAFLTYEKHRDPAIDPHKEALANTMLEIASRCQNSSETPFLMLVKKLISILKDTNMELVDLASSLVPPLIVALPDLLQAGKDVVEGTRKALIEKVGNGLAEGVCNLWSRISGSASAKKAAEWVAEDPENTKKQTALEVEIEDLLKADTAFATELKQLLEAAGTKIGGNIATASGTGAIAVGGNVGGSVTTNVNSRDS
jgi:hypothetical protein